MIRKLSKVKPSPDIFLAAAKRFEGGPVDSHTILVFEDAPAGVNAAKNAGMSRMLFVDFNPSDWGLPQFEDAKN
ncbi:hypothetical protein LWI28_000917 [Acer negundo]|uniref:Uncharacterized protein n=1 Tax=Acer negundo TaxID=4023 RepID=A0AAD5IK35_ACENE|nr:hypothetical protein LWI28_000917 [Acer negundo]KAK4842619.1 hypothetical protein QYF36_024884 [Acer negundo]